MSVVSVTSVEVKIYAPQTPFVVLAVQSPIVKVCLELSDGVATQLATQVPLALFQCSQHVRLSCRQDCESSVMRNLWSSYIRSPALQGVFVTLAE